MGLIRPAQLLAPYVSLSVVQYTTVSALNFDTAGNIDLFEPVAGNGTDKFTLSAGIDSANEDIDAHTGVWTWGGDDPITVAVLIVCSAGNFGTGEREWALGVSVNDDLDGVNLGTTPAAAAKGTQAGQVTKVDGYDTISSFRGPLVVNNGDTIKAVGALFNLNAALNIAGLSMIIVRCNG